MEVALQLPPKRGIYLGYLHLDWLGYPLTLLSQVKIMASSCPSQIKGGVTKKNFMPPPFWEKAAIS
jgi:hypothetical protein